MRNFLNRGIVAILEPGNADQRSDYVGLALFDLDNTLIAGDSDRLWGDYLAAVGAVDPDRFRQANAEFYEQYVAGTLDNDAYLRFALDPLRRHDDDALEAWRHDFITQWIEPLILDAGLQLVEDHRSRGHNLVVVTATNRFVAEPIVERFGIGTLLATEPERAGGGFTGGWVGEPTFREGKISAVDAWQRRNGIQPAERWFYSDSINDLPLLSRVEHPVAVDPDEPLRTHAEAQGWPVITLRNPE